MTVEVLPVPDHSEFVLMTEELRHVREHYEILIDTIQGPIYQKWVTFCDHVFKHEHLALEHEWDFLDSWLNHHYHAQLRSRSHPIRIQFTNQDDLVSFSLTWL